MDQLRHQLKSMALVIAACLAPAACGSEGRAGRAAAAAHVDSIVPRDVALARIRNGVVEPPSLSGGAASREALVRQFLGALERRDTATLHALLMTRAEFAYLYYPTNPEGLPPYDLSPGLMWFLLEGNSRRGLAHALEDRGGRPLRHLGVHCQPPTQQGANTVWGGCVVSRLQAPGDTVVEPLFGPIIARGGRFKFVSYANKL
ncbi:MAG: hypothetical protein ACREMI_05505 [Gemmatimonadales bacterium]